MVLRLTITDAPRLKEAIQALRMPESKNVLITWCPDYFSVKSALYHSFPAGEQPTITLKLHPHSFLTYNCTEQLFTAIVRIKDLEHVFFSVGNLDVVLFSQCLDVPNGLNNLGFLHAQWPVVPRVGEDEPIARRSCMKAMKIYGVLTESQVKSADVSRNPPPPVVTFLCPIFGRVISTLKIKGVHAVAIVVHKDEAFFSAAEGEEVWLTLSLTAENGLKWTRADLGSTPAQFEFPLANLDVEPGSKLSTEVSLYKLSEKEKLIWFKLNTSLKLRGDLIHHFC